MSKLKIKKGDKLIVISGKDKGKTGKITFVKSQQRKAVVAGINKVKKHQKPDKDQAGGIIEKEASIHVSNIMLVVSGKTTRVGYKTLDNGKKVKFAKSTGEVIN